MSARENIFSDIRRALGVTGAEAPRRDEVLGRLSAHPRGIIPKRGQAEGLARVKIFIEAAQATLASVAQVACLADVPAEAKRFLIEKNLASTLRMGSDERLAAMDWATPGLNISHGASQGGDPNAISMAFAGVAEAGLLVMTSGPQNPTTLNFLPDAHIIVVEADKIYSDFESVFDSLRVTFGTGALPRTVNCIAGPSRSADIAQTLLLGAHGPRSLHIIIVAGEAVSSAPSVL